MEYRQITEEEVDRAAQDAVETALSRRFLTTLNRKRSPRLPRSTETKDAA
ncbi:hypothetical protein [Sinorhizobium meliloti]|nr:hypothetical protein [Sinorhizobium meliloti]AEG53140.1 hypothetical protein Sinme_1393 [Sinorhizobium meliloti AK83]MDE4591145.1 hypothetical protein [Sinorhizobium meliloti]SEI55930.1 hypothetical protein SAMN04244575_01041 [Sinorhizobium meliloti]